MNKMEFQQKLDESIHLIEEGNYQEAVDQIDLLNLDSVRDTRILQLMAKAYEKCRRYDDAEDLLLQAKEIAPRGRGTLFHLCTLAIKAGNIGDAMVYYNQFCDVAKNDAERFVLQYRIAQAENKGDDELITILENFKGEEPDDRWMYELAKLYAINDRTNEALEVCDEITLWFYNGKYVRLAKELRSYLTGEPIEEEEPYQEPAPTEEVVTQVIAGGEKKETPEEEPAGEEEPEETPQTVISADAWDADGIGEELFGTEQAEEIPETEDSAEPLLEEPETEELIPGIDENAFSEQESTAFAGMSGSPVPVTEEDRSETGRIMAEVPELPEGRRPDKAELYRIVPEFETISEQAATEDTATVLPVLSAFSAVDEEKAATETAAKTAAESLSETLTEKYSELSTEKAAETVTAAGIAAETLTETVTDAVTEGLAGILPKTESAETNEAEFDLAELDRFTEAQIRAGEEAAAPSAEEAARLAEEERLKAEEAARIAEEAARKAEEEAARLAEEEARKAEEEAARLAEEERQKAEAEAARITEETEKSEEPVEVEAEPENTEKPVEAEPENTEEPAEAEPEKTEEPVETEAEPEKAEEEPTTADDTPEMETEVVAALTLEGEAKEEAPVEETPEETPEECGPFAGMKLNPGPEDAYRNFIVVGENPEETLERAKTAMKALSEREGLAGKMRMTKLPAAKLKGIQISAAFGQFRDKMVIIENASELSDAQLEDFAALLPKEEVPMVLCLTDTKGNMASLFGRVNALASSFDAVFEDTEITEESLFKIIRECFEAEDAVFTEEGEAVAKEYVRDELMKAGNDARTLASEFAAKVIHTAEHGGLFGLFSGRVDEEGFLHVTDKNVRKAIKK